VSIEFMVIAAPRSGTGWAANWLTTDSTLCYHGLAARVPVENWPTLKSARMLGTAETAMWWANKKLNAHPARKLILHRRADEICASLQMPDLVERVEWMQASLHGINGMHVQWDQLFHDPAPIYEHLLQRPFDADRHAELVRLQVTCFPKRATFDRAAYLRIREEMAACAT
jgi:hypothetical protein